MHHRLCDGKVIKYHSSYTEILEYVHLEINLSVHAEQITQHNHYMNVMLSFVTTTEGPLGWDVKTISK